MNKSLRPIVATTYYADSEHIKVYLAPYKPYFVKTNEGKRPIKIRFSYLEISPGGYPVSDILNIMTKEDYESFYTFFEYRIHPIDGVFEFDSDEIEKRLKGKK